MEAKYHVASDPNCRAFGGTSSGGAATMYALFNHTRAFRYYLPMSALITWRCKPNYQAVGILDTRICFGYGWYDSVFSRVPEPNNATGVYAHLHDIFTDLAATVVPFTNHAVFGGHSWTTWRKNLVYMLENVLWK